MLPVASGGLDPCRAQGPPAGLASPDPKESPSEPPPRSLQTELAELAELRALAAQVQGTGRGERLVARWAGA